MGAAPERRAATLEGQVARVADIIAYVNHDIDDAMRAGILQATSLPAEAVEVLGGSSSERIGRMVTDVVEQSVRRPEAPEIGMSGEVLEATLTLREFLFAAVYENDAATAEFGKVAGILESLWSRVRSEPARFLDRATLERAGLDVASRDFLAGMTDRFAIGLFEELFVPRSWGERSGSGVV